MPPLRTWHRAFAGSFDEAVATARWLDAAAADADVSPNMLYAMQVCLEELLTNIIRHGGRANPKIAVTIGQFDDRMELVVEDDGLPFDVAQVEPKRATARLEDVQPGGLGITLIQGFADSLVFRREGLGNKVVAQFLRQGVPKE